MRWPLVVLAVPTVFGGLLQTGSLIPGELPVSWVTLILTLLLAAGAIWLVVRLARTAAEGDPLATLSPRLQDLLLNGFGIDAVAKVLSPSTSTMVRCLSLQVISPDSRRCFTVRFT